MNQIRQQIIPNQDNCRIRKKDLCGNANISRRFKTPSLCSRLINTAYYAYHENEIKSKQGRSRKNHRISRIKYTKNLYEIKALSRRNNRAEYLYEQTHIICTSHRVYDPEKHFQRGNL